MKRYTVFSLAIAVLLLLLSSCEPRVLTMNVEMRNPSASGMDFTGKTMAVVYLDDMTGRDSVYSLSLANGFASTLEEDYFNGEEVIEIYRMERLPFIDYSAKDTLVNLIMDTSMDVVFLFDAPEFGDVSVKERFPSALDIADSSQIAKTETPLTQRLYIYDSMGRDTVRAFRGVSTLRTNVFVGEDYSNEEIEACLWPALDAVGETAGRQSAEKFTATWKKESFQIYYFESPSAWSVAAQAAYEYKWKLAIDTWMSLLGANEIKRSYAEYNIAVALYILGDYALAKKWLDRAEDDNSSLMPSRLLRSKINLKLE